jgi:hypothetical protein
MPGGVGGARSGILTAPIPILQGCRYVAEGKDAGSDAPGMTGSVQVYETVISSPRPGQLSGLLKSQPVCRFQKDLIEFGFGRVGLGVPVVAPGHFRWQ